MNQRLRMARAEAAAVNGWLLAAVGFLKRRMESANSKPALSAECAEDMISEARAALNRFEDIVHGS